MLCVINFVLLMVIRWSFASRHLFGAKEVYYEHLKHIYLPQIILPAFSYRFNTVNQSIQYS